MRPARHACERISVHACVHENVGATLSRATLRRAAPRCATLRCARDLLDQAGTRCPCTCLRTCPHTCPGTGLHTRPYTCVHTRLHTCLYACLYTYLHTYLQTRPYAHVHTHVYTHVHIHVCTHVCRHDYTHVYTRVYPHTCRDSRSCLVTPTRYAANLRQRKKTIGKTIFFSLGESRSGFPSRENKPSGEFFFSLRFGLPLGRKKQRPCDPQLIRYN